MELIFIIMSTAVGTIVGSVAGVLLAQRVKGSPSKETMALQGQLRASDTALAEATATLTELRKQATELNKTVLDRNEELKKSHEQLERAKVAAIAGNSDLTAQELALRVAAMAEQCAALEAQARQDAIRATEMAGVRAAELEEKMEALKAELVQQNLLTIESRNQAAQLQQQLTGAGTRIGELTESVATAEAVAQRVAVLEGELAAERLNLQQAVEQIQQAEADAAARQQVQDALAEEVASGRQLCADLQQKLEDAVTETQRIPGLESELAGEQQRVQNLTAEFFRITADLAEQQRNRATLEEQLASQRKELEDAAQRLAEATAGSADDGEKIAAIEAQAAGERERAAAELADSRQQLASFETQLTAEQARSEGLLAQIADLEAKLQEERKNASRGMAALSAAQENLARVFKAMNMEVPANLAAEPANGNGHKPQAELLEAEQQPV
jgi:colicin import membrane protein